MTTLEDGMWPLPSLAEYGDPVISDGFRREPSKHRPRGHLGVDICFRRPESGDFDLPDFARHFCCPKGTTVHACAPGEVWSVQDRPNGFAVRIDHGAPFVSVYRHTFEPIVKKGQVVEAGEMLGFVGYDPRNPRAFRHSHFELHRFDKPGPHTHRNTVIDPAPLMKHWEFLR